MNNRIMILIILLSITASADAVGDSQSRIDGVTNFLIERANENYLYFFENSIKENTSLKCYFGQTVENMELGGLKELLLSNGLWQSSLEKDFEGIQIRVTVWVISRSIEEIESTIEKLVVKNKSSITKLQAMNKIEGFLADKSLTDQEQAVKDAVDYFLAFKIDDSDKLKKKLCGISVDDREMIEAHIEALKSINDALLGGLDDVTTQQKTLGLLAAAGLGTVAAIDKSKLHKVKSDLKGLSGKLKKIEKLSETFNKEGDYTVKAIAAFDLIRNYSFSGNNNKIKEIKPENKEELAKLIRENKEKGQEEIDKIKRHVLFFARIADSDDPEIIKGILTAYTLPAVSFFEKRDNSRHWFISSYLGVSSTLYEADVDEDEFEHGNIFAPIGLEYSWGYLDLWAMDSISVMVAPFDFGNPVNLKIRGVDEDVDFDEIIAPTLSINFGFRKSPVAWGIIYQKGKKYDASNSQGYRVMMHLSFDMPLFVF